MLTDAGQNQSPRHLQSESSSPAAVYYECTTSVLLLLAATQQYVPETQGELRRSGILIDSRQALDATLRFRF